ncbi:MAG: TetR/AcrR family transcriptional regulator [bacterium]
MPKSFSSTERERIRSTLLTKGYEMFARVGVKKTSIDELAAAAGISKGSFYTFFESKEAMVLELFEQEEQSRDELLLQLQSAPEEVSIEDFFLEISRFIKENRLIKTLYKTGELTALSRGISDQALHDHQQQDTAFVESVLHHFRTAGLSMDISSETFSAVLRLLFFAALHEREVGPGYDQGLAFLFHSVAEALKSPGGN